MSNIRLATNEEYGLIFRGEGTGLQGLLDVDHADIRKVFGNADRRSCLDDEHYHWVLLVNGSICRLYNRYGEEYALRIGCASSKADQVKKDLGDFLREKGVQFSIEEY